MATTTVSTASTLAPTRRNFFCFAPAALAVAALPAIPAPSTPSAALVAYRDVMSRADAVNAGNDWPAVEQFCLDEIAAVQALAEEPTTGHANFLRKVIALTERADHTGWNMMDCEADLLEAVQAEAEIILKRIAS